MGATAHTSPPRFFADPSRTRPHSYEEYVPLKKRREQEAYARLARLGRAPAPSAAPATSDAAPPSPSCAAAPPKESLLVAAARARKDGPTETDSERVLREEREMMAAITAKQALKSAKELATGATLTTRALNTGWVPPGRLRAASAASHQATRDAAHIVCEGERLPPPITDFSQTRAPAPLLAALRAKGITKPTPIQMQGLPTILSGRDMIGIAFTGSGKTLVFSLPLILFALQEEVRYPLAQSEGPIGMIVAPSRELARQTLLIIDDFCDALAAGGEWPRLRTLLAVGGVDGKAQSDALRAGVHIVVATPGRLKDLLTRRRMNLDACRYLCLDEADRMVDLGFEDDVRTILSFFRAPRQTLMFSATMPAKIRAFAESALVDPVLVNVGRSGAASLDVIQEVEYVKQDAKLPYLLDALQKTAPPAIIFAENQRDVDYIHEYLLMKGVDAVSAHGGKDQADRVAAVDAFKAGEADVLVATDVASKGLDFPDIQHVINFDMPSEIENYVHRIGRTGRCGKTGVATTFVNKNQADAILLDLKHLLQEAKQRVPPFLLALADPVEELQALADASGTKGCAYCGGLGHRIAACPKLDAQNREAERSRKDYFGSGGFGGEM